MSDFSDEAKHRNIGEVLIGSIISDPSKFQLVDGIIKTEYLDGSRLQHIYMALSEIIKRNMTMNPAVILAVMEELGVEHYTSLQELRALGEIDLDLSVCQDLAHQLADDFKFREAQDRIDELQIALNQPGLTNHERQSLMDTVFDDIKRTTSRNDTLVFADEVVGRLEAAFTNPNAGRYIASGHKNFDLLTGGYRKRWMYVVAARPGGYKSTLIHNHVLNIANSGVPCLVYPLEMDPEDYILRMAATNNQLFGIRELFRPELLVEDQRGHIIREIMPTFRRMPIAFNRSSLQNIEVRPKTILRDALVFQQKMGTKDFIIFVDYIGLMSGNKNGNDERSQLADISRNLKIIAGILDVPVVAVAQMNREGEKKQKDEEPNLSHLAGADNIGRDADFVMFLRNEEEEPDIIKGYAVKHRNGPNAQLFWQVQKQHGRLIPVQR